MKKLVSVTAEYSAEQVRAGADTIQIFDSWVGCLSVEDYRRYVLPHVTDLVKRLQKTGVPIIYFGTDSSTLLPSMQETGAEVIGLDWRIPLEWDGRVSATKARCRAISIPCCSSPNGKRSNRAPKMFCARLADAPATSLILGHGILQETPVENVKALCAFVREHSAEFKMIGSSGDRAIGSSRINR